MMLPTSLTTFLAWLLTPVGCGAFVYGCIQLLDQYWPGSGLTGTQKFYGALVLSILVPLGAYAGEVALTLIPFTTEGIFEAMLVAYVASQIAYRQTKLQTAAKPIFTTLEAAAAPLIPIPVAEAPMFRVTGVAVETHTSSTTPAPTVLLGDPPGSPRPLLGDTSEVPHG